MSDPTLSLDARSGLPEAMRGLLAERPRETWSDPRLPETARFWLQMHDGFRREQAVMTDLARRGGDSRDAARIVHPQLIRVLGGFLQHLDGHHRIESGHYFPQFRRIDPRVMDGLDLLDRDHDAIHARLEALHAAGLAYHQAVGAGVDATTTLHRLAEVLDGSGPALLRHLDDEEEIIIPLICLHGDGA